MTADWTLLVYMAGDNNLRSGAELDLRELAAANSNVNVGVQLDLPDRRTQRWIVENHVPVVDMTLAGNVNSGDPRSLTDFIEWGKDKFPAPNYGVIISSHGGGFLDFPAEVFAQVTEAGRNHVKVLAPLRFSRFRKTITRRANEILRPTVRLESIAPDDTAHDFLEDRETREALATAQRQDGKYGLLGCDACFMAMVEVAHELRDLGVMLVASQEVEDKEGWPYGDVTRNITTGLSAEQVATMIVEAYAARTTKDPASTLSAVRLDAMTTVAAALDRLGAALQPALTGRMRLIARARRATRAFELYDYIDLRQFAENIAAQFRSEPESAAIVEAAEAVVEAVETAVLVAHGKTGGAFGLSIYLPNTPVTPQYANTSLSAAAPDWATFVTRYGAERGLLG